MKYFYILLFLIAQHGFAQQIQFTTGIGTYALKSMKSHGENLQQSFPVDARFVDKFPSYPFYTLSILQRIGNCYVGGSGSYGSTGARINYTDYSGSISADQNVRYFEFGAPFAVLLNRKASLGFLKFTAKPTVVFGRYVLLLTTRLGDTIESEKAKFTSVNLGIESGLSYSRKVFKSFELELQGGYNFNFYKGELLYSTNDSYSLEDKDGKKVTLDWSGFRVGLGIAYQLKR
jgi:hypothetical protein